jgi:dihydroorotate dehydrogenase electron transfer subunit
LFIIKAPVEKSIELDHDIYLLKIYCPEIAREIKPGQFLNIRVSETLYPLLRRPFSVCDVEGDHIIIMFNIYGEGTRILSRKHNGDLIDILGPLGNGFNLNDNYDTAIIVAGGLGAAPFPFFTRSIDEKRKVYTFIGGRTHRDVIKYAMKNILVATDDGSEGFKGTIVELLEKEISSIEGGKYKLFGCGPNAMLSALRDFSIKNNIDCEVSAECAMACGFGICQGCPIESTIHPEQYYLVCKDGPIFNVKDILI